MLVTKALRQDVAPLAFVPTERALALFQWVAEKRADAEIRSLSFGDFLNNHYNKWPFFNSDNYLQLIHSSVKTLEGTK